MRVPDCIGFEGRKAPPDAVLYDSMTNNDGSIVVASKDDQAVPQYLYEFLAIDDGAHARFGSQVGGFSFGPAAGGFGGFGCTGAPVQAAPFGTGQGVRF